MKQQKLWNIVLLPLLSCWKMIMILLVMERVVRLVDFLWPWSWSLCCRWCGEQWHRLIWTSIRINLWWASDGLLVYKCLKNIYINFWLWCNGQLCWQDYFGECSESVISDNVVIVYELLEEMLDNGFPLATESNVLKEMIRPPNILRSVVNTLTGNWRSPWLWSVYQPLN